MTNDIRATRNEPRQRKIICEKWNGPNAANHKCNKLTTWMLYWIGLKSTNIMPHSNAIDSRSGAIGKSCTAETNTSGWICALYLTTVIYNFYGNCQQWNRFLSQCAQAIAALSQQEHAMKWYIPIHLSRTYRFQMLMLSKLISCHKWIDRRRLLHILAKEDAASAEKQPINRSTICKYL